MKHLKHYSTPEQVQLLDQMLRINHALAQIDLMGKSTSQIPDVYLNKYEQYLNLLNELGEKLDKISNHE